MSSLSAMTIAAIIMLVLLGVLIAFQLGLALGKPWGAMAYGGNWPGVLPKGLRINSGVFALVMYPIVALYVLDAGGLASFDWLPARSSVIWVAGGFFLIGAVMNLVSRSKPERWWAPVSLALAICAGVLAFG